MRFLIRGLAGVAVLAVLALAAYGGWALLIDDAPSGSAATESVLQQSPASAPVSTSQDTWQELCTRHMAEMQPVMEQMMRDMTPDMMDGGGGGGMMDGGMMGR